MHREELTLVLPTTSSVNLTCGVLFGLHFQLSAYQSIFQR